MGESGRDPNLRERSGNGGGEEGGVISLRGKDKDPLPSPKSVGSRTGKVWNQP